MNLREDKGWAYGAFTLMLDARGQRPFIAYAPVQTDKTKESMMEIQKELEMILGDMPATSDEVEKAQKNQTLTLAGQWETGGAVMGSIAEMVQFGLPDDHFNTYTDRVSLLEYNASKPGSQRRPSSGEPGMGCSWRSRNRLKPASVNSDSVISSC